MIEFLIQYSGQIANVMAIIIPIIGVMAWSHRSLRADIKEIRQDVKEVHQRIDAVGTRIDHLYEVMLGMLKKKSSE